MYVGNFEVMPPWDPAVQQRPPDRGIHRILLDPGVVFGTGLHPTTRDCISAIQEAFHRKHHDVVVDIGTGTGILAIAASMMGSRVTMAVDINFLSVQTARKNIRLNRLNEKIIAIQGSAENIVDYPVDFMIANIHYDVMKKILNSDEFYQKKYFLLSGLLKSQAISVKDQLLQHYNVELIHTWDQNGIWFTFLGENH